MKFKVDRLIKFLIAMDMSLTEFEDFVGKETSNKALHGQFITDVDDARALIEVLGASVSMACIDWEGSGIEKPDKSRIFNYRSYAY